MIQAIHPEPKSALLTRYLPLAWKILRAALILVLFCAWVWMADMLTYLSLDYPLRRAGDSIEYPPAGTLAFYVGCAEALFGHSFLPVAVLAFVLSFLSKGFGVTRWRSRFLLSLALLTLPVVAIGSHDIYVGVQFIRANPRP